MVPNWQPPTQWVGLAYTGLKPGTKTKFRTRWESGQIVNTAISDDDKMELSQHAVYARLAWIGIAFAAAPVMASGQTDEIQVYDANIAEQGKFNLMVHNNFTPDGLKTPAFPGGVESNRALVGVAEGRTA